MEETKESIKNNDNQGKIPEKEKCGIIMPISETSLLYNEDHWKDVKGIITEAADMASYDAQLVSESKGVNYIHHNIVQNLYTSKIVICDISTLNPNVMFELGLRFVFDKPIIIIKDDKTPNIFDINIINYIEYPSNLRYAAIVQFKEHLKTQIEDTIEISNKGGYSPFLGHFKDIEITPPILEKETMSSDKLIIDKLEQIQYRLSRIENYSFINNIENRPSRLDELDLQREFYKYYKEVPESKKIELDRNVEKWREMFYIWLNSKYDITLFPERIDNKVTDVICDILPPF